MCDMCPREGALKPILAAARTGGSPQRRGKGWRTGESTVRAPPRLRFLPHAPPSSLLNYYDSLLLLRSLQCFTIVTCYDTSRPRTPVFFFHGSLATTTDSLPFPSLCSPFYSPTLRYRAGPPRYSANREITSFRKRDFCIFFRWNISFFPFFFSRSAEGSSEFSRIVRREEINLGYILQNKMVRRLRAVRKHERERNGSDARRRAGCETRGCENALNLDDNIIIFGWDDDI